MYILDQIYVLSIFAKIKVHVPVLSIHLLYIIYFFHHLPPARLLHWQCSHFYF